MSLSYAFFALISRMKYIHRWSLMRNTSLENIQEHSHMVAVLAHALAVLHNRYFGGQVDPGAVALAALYHDAPEILTGDMPTPIKYYSPELESSYKAVEAVSCQKLLNMLPDDLTDIYRPLLQQDDPEIHLLVKAADKLSAYLKCVEERKAGNLEFRQAEAQTLAALKSYPLPALNHFMTHFLPAFELTLDELE